MDFPSGKTAIDVGPSYVTISSTGVSGKTLTSVGPASSTFSNP
jgi:hypothetical protein